MIKSNTLACEDMIYCKIGPNKEDLGFKKLEDIKINNQELSIILSTLDNSIKNINIELEESSKKDIIFSSKIAQLELRIIKLENAIEKLAKIILEEVN